MGNMRIVTDSLSSSQMKDEDPMIFSDNKDLPHTGAGNEMINTFVRSISSYDQIDATCDVLLH